jgi:hypothetical protein
MSKPICVIKVDTNRIYFGSSISSISDVQRIVEERLNDYHVLVIPFNQPADEYYEPMQIQVFYEKDFTEIQYQELKELITNSINENT